MKNAKTLAGVHTHTHTLCLLNKIKNKREEGITLISLIITIIVLIILASTAIYSGISTINASKLTAFEAELRIMQSRSK